MALGTTTRVGTLKLYLAPGLAAGSRIDLTIDPERAATSLSNGLATIVESVPDGSAGVMNTCIVVQ